MHSSFISKHKVLSRAEERELFYKIERGDVRALNSIVEHNLRFAIRMASQYSGYGVPTDDLFQEACLGMIHAAKRFKADRGVKFMSYAAHWMKAYILTYCRRQSFDVCTAKTLENRSAFIKNPAKFNLDSRLTGRESDTRLGGVDDGVYQKELFVLLARVNKHVVTSKVDEAVFAGLTVSDERETQSNIGKQFGVSRECIRQHERKIGERIKRILLQKHPDVVLNYC